MSHGTPRSLFATSFAATTVALGLLLASCETPAGKVSVLSGDTSALVSGSTYAWAPVADPGGGDPRIDNDIVRDRIRSAVDTALAAKGYRQVAPSDARLLVAYHIGLQNRTDYSVDTMGPGLGGGVACGRRGCVGGYGWGLYGAPVDVDIRSDNYVEGALMLDLVDARSGKLAWRVTSQKRVDAKDVDQAAVNAVLADMTKTLPGATAG